MAATRVEVTIAASDYSFSSSGCGQWTQMLRTMMFYLEFYSRFRQVGTKGGTDLTSQNRGLVGLWPARLAYAALALCPTALYSGPLFLALCAALHTYLGLVAVHAKSFRLVNRHATSRIEPLGPRFIGES